MQSTDPNCQLMDDNRWWAVCMSVVSTTFSLCLLTFTCALVISVDMFLFVSTCVILLTYTDNHSLSRTELVFSVTRELLSIPSSSLSPPLFTPPNLLSLLSRYVDRQRLELLQDKLQWVTSAHWCGVGTLLWTTQHEKNKLLCWNQLSQPCFIFVICLGQS